MSEGIDITVDYIELRRKSEEAVRAYADWKFKTENGSAVPPEKTYQVVVGEKLIQALVKKRAEVQSLGAEIIETFKYSKFDREEVAMEKYYEARMLVLEMTILNPKQGDILAGILELRPDILDSEVVEKLKTQFMGEGQNSVNIVKKASDFVVANDKNFLGISEQQKRIFNKLASKEPEGEMAVVLGFINGVESVRNGISVGQVEIISGREESISAFEMMKIAERDNELNIPGSKTLRGIKNQYVNTKLTLEGKAVVLSASWEIAKAISKYDEFMEVVTCTFGDCTCEEIEKADMPLARVFSLLVIRQFKSPGLTQAWVVRNEKILARRREDEKMVAENKNNLEKQLEIDERRKVIDEYLRSEEVIALVESLLVTHPDQMNLAKGSAIMALGRMELAPGVADFAKMVVSEIGDLYLNNKTAYLDIRKDKVEGKKGVLNFIGKTPDLMVTTITPKQNYLVSRITDLKKEDGGKYDLNLWSKIEAWDKLVRGGIKRFAVEV